MNAVYVAEYSELAITDDYIILSIHSTAERAMKRCEDHWNAKATDDVEWLGWRQGEDASVSIADVWDMWPDGGGMWLMGYRVRAFTVDLVITEVSA